MHAFVCLYRCFILIVEDNVHFLYSTINLKHRKRYTNACTHIYFEQYRSSKFSLSIVVLQKLAPWSFALDHMHYSCQFTFVIGWITLQEKHPQRGCIVHKTKRPFSEIAVDQAHEIKQQDCKWRWWVCWIATKPKALLR